MKLNGVNSLRKKLRKNATMADVKHVVKSNGSKMTQNSQRLAPVDTGFLKRNIKQNIDDGGLTSTTKPENVEYAAYVEYGTRFQTKQPYIKPSFDAQKKVFINDLERLMK